MCRQATELQIEYDNWPRIVTKIDGVNKASMPFLHFRPIKLHLGSVWGPAMIKSESIYGLIYSCLMIIQLLLLLKLLLLFTKVKGIQITCESMAFQWEQEIWFSIACCGNFCCPPQTAETFCSPPYNLPKFLINGTEKLLSFSNLNFGRDLRNRKCLKSELISQQNLSSIHHRNAFGAQ